MKAAVLDELGAIPRYGEFDEPVSMPGEALVQVAAAAIKPVDRAIASGTHYASPHRLPVVCGMDGVGHTDSGELVYFMTVRQPFGAMAQRAPAAWTVAVPAGLSPSMAAAVVNPALAAWLPLVWRGRLRKGETVMVLGATGTAGRFAVRAARLLGAGRVVAAGRRQDVLRSLGADAAIDLTLPDVELERSFRAETAQGVDVIVDYVWGTPVEVLLRSIVMPNLGATRRETPVRLVSVGEMAGAEISLPSAALRASRVEMLGSGTANLPGREIMQGFVADILSRAATAELAVKVSDFPLAEVSRAWERAGLEASRPVLVIN